MADARTLAAHIKTLKFATDLPEKEEDAGSGLQVKITITIPLLTPADVETLAYMQSEGRTRLTLLQEQLPMFGKGGEKTE